MVTGLENIASKNELVKTAYECAEAFTACKYKTMQYDMVQYNSVQNGLRMWNACDPEIVVQQRMTWWRRLISVLNLSQWLNYNTLQYNMIYNSIENVLRTWCPRS